MFLHKKKSLIFLVVFLMVIGGFGLFFYQRNAASAKDAAAQKTAKVIKTDLKIAFSIDGKLVIDSYEPNFSVSGKIAKVLVKEGDVVKKGQWLALLDTQEAQKDLEKSLLDYSKERNDFDQDTQVTYADKVITDTFKRILEKNQWDLSRAVLDVELSNLAIQQSKLVAPIEGVVAAINIKAGGYASTQNQTPAITIVQPDSLQFIAYAEEDDVLRITEEQSTNIVLQAYPKDQFPAKVVFVSPRATLDTNGIASYKVAADIENQKNLKLIDGMEGSLSFVAKEVKNVLAIPNKSIIRENNQTYVLVKKENAELVKTAIQTAFTDGKNVEVTSGLELGQEVVVGN